MGTGVEVIKGSTALLTCTISNLAHDVSVEWISDPAVPAEKIDSPKNSNGVQVSVLSIENAQSDSTYTCLIKSITFNQSEESQRIVSMNTYGNSLYYLMFAFFIVFWEFG